MTIDPAVETEKPASQDFTFARDCKPLADVDEKVDALLLAIDAALGQVAHETRPDLKALRGYLTDALDDSGFVAAFERANEADDRVGAWT